MPSVASVVNPAEHGGRAAMPDFARLLDAVIAATLAEGVALAAYRAATGRGLEYRELVAFLGAGASLLVAMRLAVSEAPFVAFGAAMLAALALHAWFVAQRWRR